MRIAVPDFVSSSFIPLIVAKELGFFEEEGQDIEIVPIRAPRDVEALSEGAVDFSAGTAHAPLKSFPEWRGVKLVAAVSQGTPWMLVLQSALAKRGEMKAVKGRRIGADRGGPELIFKFLLQEGGIDIERDRVEMVPPTTDTRISFGVAAARALKEGKVDGIWCNVLGCELAVHLGGGSVVVDTRRGDGPPGARNYSFAALATTEPKVEAEPERIIEGVIRALVRAQSVIRHDPARATEVARKLFPPIEAELMGQILIRDAEFYQPSISMEAINEMNRFATAVGLLLSPVRYDQVVATRFRSLWSES